MSALKDDDHVWAAPNVDLGRCLKGLHGACWRLMKWMETGVVMAMSVGAAAATPSPLMRYIDHSRVIVVAAPGPSDEALRRQDTILRQAQPSLRQRDLVVVRALGSGGEADALRRAVRLEAGRFGVALVGKDGGVKLRSTRPITAEALFAIIDAMPMRRQEMRRKPDRSRPASR